jgi:SNF2 family DNA or RNA helicase
VPPVLTRTEDALVLDLSSARGSEFQDALNKTRDIAGRRFDFANKLWVFPAEPGKAEEVINMVRPVVDDEVRQWIIESKKLAEEDLLTPLPDDAKVRVPWGHQRCAWQPESVNDEPFNGLLDYQRAAVDHLATVQRAILADDMGLGKTLEGISAVEEWRLRNPLKDGSLPSGPRLVVCPASVMGGWRRELERWLEPGSFGLQLIDGYNKKKRHQQLVDAIKGGLWVVANWEQLEVETQKIKVQHRGGSTSWQPVKVLKQPLFHIPHVAWLDPTLDDLDPRLVQNAAKRPDATGWLAILADEAHRAKNRNALRTKGLFKTHANIMLALTGTPIMNSPDEMWSLLRWLWPEQYTSFERFFREYVDYYENPAITGGKPIITGVKNSDQLRFEIKGRVVQRTAGSVRSLPGKRRIYYNVDLLPEQQELYDEAEVSMWLAVEQAAKRDDKEGENARAFLQAAESGASISQLYNLPNGAARMVRLRQIIETPANLGGAPDSAIIDDFLQKYEDSRPEPWLVFCEFKPTTAVVAEAARNKFGARVAVYTGETPAAERTKMEDAFQLGQLDLIVGTIGALKEGITLTYGHLQHWMSRAWVPSTNEQGESRQANRIGQQQHTMIYIPQGAGTVAETKIPITLRRKEGIVRAVIAQDAIEEVTLG